MADDLVDFIAKGGVIVVVVVVFVLAYLIGGGW